MVRAPCCEKMGLKKGPWTPEEDQILISYIQGFGHGNWRALPKQAGLLRCGKSCRLRWTNYLRPDIKRGNLSREEEEAIIKLHEMLGNRWSAIAARLPGRTDNEIKNVWHTHLKKRLKPNLVKTTHDETQQDLIKISQLPTNHNVTTTRLEEHMNSTHEAETQSFDNSSVAFAANSPQNSSEFDLTSATTDSSPETLLEFNESIWSDEELRRESSFASFDNLSFGLDDNNMDFWFNLLLEAEDIPTLELPEL